MDADLKQDKTDLGKVFHQFKEAMETASTERKQYGTELGETKGMVEKMQDRMDQIEGSITKSVAMAENTKEAKAQVAAEQKAAFMKFVRLDFKGLDPEERKLLSRSDDTTGGFLAPPEYVREIIKGVVEQSPMRELARIRTTSNQSIQIPTRTGTFSAQWTSEASTRSETTGLSWGLEDIPTHEMYAMVDITEVNLEDSEFDLEAELNEEFVEQFAVTEGSGFFTGNGAGQPEGFLNNATIGTVNSGSASALTADGLIDLYFALKTAYARNASWLLNRLAIRDIRKLKDQNDQYLWQPGLADGVPSTILERPYREATDMPVVAASSKSVAIGDWRKGYTIVDRVAMSTLRDPYTQAASGAIRFWARRRVGGQCVLPEAIKIQVTST